MKLIVGLGNPGRDYNNTRHNVGFNVIDLLVKKYGLSFNENKKFNALECCFNLNGEKVIFVKPLTYMNLSGNAVKKIVDFYNINSQDILIMHDDLDMVLGKIKVVNNSSSGGHNGLKSITKAIQTRDYVRFKIGIYGKDRMIDAIDCVLGKFSKEQREVLDEVYAKVGNLLEDFVNCDIARLKQIYNSMNKKNDL